MLLHAEEGISSERSVVFYFQEGQKSQVALLLGWDQILQWRNDGPPFNGKTGADSNGDKKAKRHFEGQNKR